MKTKAGIVLVSVLTVIFASMSVGTAEASTLRGRALKVARAQLGDGYQWGAEGPHKFDCSGLVWYSYTRVNQSVPRTAQAQYNKANHISVQSRTLGDLVFIGNSSGSIYHVGIYAGHGKILNANSGSYRGRKVVVAPISEYTSGSPQAYYGRYR